MTRRMIGPAVMPLEQRCPSCQSANASTTKFCGECGYKFSGKESAPAVRPPATSVAGRTHRCERKQLTVLFTDVSSFTAMSERLDSEVVFEIMEQALEVILDQVHRCGGTVNQFLGDGVMALFGESSEQHHADRAVSAALAIQEHLEPLRIHVHETYGIEFRMRITINSGDVTLGTIGDSLRTDYAAAGHTVNVAARMLQVARPGDILVSDHTRRLVADSVLTQHVGDITTDDGTGATEIHSVLDWNLESVAALVCA